MNVLEKLQTVRNELQKEKLTQSGKNAFVNFNYFQLSDFINHVTNLCLKHGICPIITFNKEYATLTVYNNEDKTDFVTFECPFVIAQVKASNIQCLGSSITYYRRYLYTMAFEVSDADGIDCLSDEDRMVTDKVKLPNEERDTRIKYIKSKAKDNKDVIIAAMKNYKVGSIDELDEEQLDKLISVLK